MTSRRKPRKGGGEALRPTSVAFTPSEAAALKEAAVVLDRSASWIVRVAVAEYLARNLKGRGR